MLDYLKNNNYVKEVKPTVKLDIANNVKLSVNAIRNLDVSKVSDHDLYQMCLQDWLLV